MIGNLCVPVYTVSVISVFGIGLADHATSQIQVRTLYCLRDTLPARAALPRGLCPPPDGSALLFTAAASALRTCAAPLPIKRSAGNSDKWFLMRIAPRPCTGLISIRIRRGPRHLSGYPYAPTYSPLLYPYSSSASLSPRFRAWPVPPMAAHSTHPRGCCREASHSPARGRSAGTPSE